MRVLHFYKTYKPDSQGGTEQLIWQLCTGTAARGVESSVLTVSKQRGTTDLGNHKHYRVREDLSLASANFSLAAFGEFKRLAAQADVIHYHFPYPFADMVHFGTGIGRRKPTVVTYHSDIVKQKQLLRLYRPLMQRFLGSVDRIVATSPNYVETSPVLSGFKDKVDVVPIGIDKAAYPVPDALRLATWRQRLGARFFLFVGNLRYYKGLHILLEALAGTQLPMVIVGNGTEEQALKAQAARLRLQNVHFAGAVDDLDKISLLTLCEALIFPSHLRSEAFGISLLEGAMYGKPLLSCEIGTGTSYVNQKDVTGLIVEAANPSALRDGMQWLWEHPEQAVTMGATGERRYRALFTADKMVDSYIGIYEKVLVHAR